MAAENLPAWLDTGTEKNIRNDAQKNLCGN